MFDVLLPANLATSNEACGYCHQPGSNGKRRVPVSRNSPFLPAWRQRQFVIRGPCPVIFPFSVGQSSGAFPVVCHWSKASWSIKVVARSAVRIGRQSGSSSRSTGQGSEKLLDAVNHRVDVDVDVEVFRQWDKNVLWCLVREDFDVVELQSWSCSAFRLSWTSSNS